jgi:hypothetical protein
MDHLLSMENKSYSSGRISIKPKRKGLEALDEKLFYLVLRDCVSQKQLIFENRIREEKNMKIFLKDAVIY